MVQEPLKKPRELPAIPGYRIEGIVGRGATGVVYRARQTSVDRVVALKVLHQELVGSASALRRMQREARLTAKLAHPNIISAIDMGDVGGQLWYAMELVDGLSLAERIAERPLSEREALRIFIPLCEALAHAHECGVVHRDIKPANILIERGGRPLLVDLGLAYDEKDPVLTKSGGTLGTPHYISPEQARDPASADVQSDLWSLGATMYHAVTGRTPFRGESVAEILSSVLYERVGDPREHAGELSNGFVLVLRKCLTRDKQARYRDPSELLSDLERLRERRAPRSSARGLDPLERRPLAGPRLWLAVAGGVLLAAGAIGLGWRALRPAEDAGRSSTADDPLSGWRAPSTTGRRRVRRGPGRVRATGGLRAARRSARASAWSRCVDGWSRAWRASSAPSSASARPRSAACSRRATRRGASSPRAARRASSRASGKPARAAREAGQRARAWQRAQLARVAAAHDEAEEAFTDELDRYVSEVLLPQCDELEHQGDWKSARELVARAPERLLADSRAPRRAVWSRTCSSAVARRCASAPTRGARRSRRAGRAPTRSSWPGSARAPTSSRARSTSAAPARRPPRSSATSSWSWRGAARAPSACRSGCRTTRSKRP